MYYKVLDNKTKKIIDVLQNPKYIKFLPHGRIYNTNRQTAHGVLGRDGRIYSFTNNVDPDIITITLYEITEEEFTRLESLVNSGTMEIDPVALEAAIVNKITELSNTCNERITNGFTVQLSDCTEYRFHLTTEDQLNLLQHEFQYQQGIKSFVYHAAGCPCVVFSRKDMAKILSKFKRHVLYHTTYFNTAKQYLKTLVDINKITNFTYGVDVSNHTKDAAIKRILKGGDNF